MHTLRTVPRRLLAGSGALLLTTALALAGAPASAATGADTVGYVRLAHLSPDTPAVDVYLAAPDATKPQVFEGVGYGVVSDYLELAPGRYAVAMREAGAPRAIPGAHHRSRGDQRRGLHGGRCRPARRPRPAGAQRRSLAPTDGRAKVRVVQASVRTPVLDVAAADGPVIADGVQFATTTEYQQVEPGSWRLRLTGAGGPSANAEVRLTGGAVYSLLVLDAKQGGLTAELRRDAEGGTVVPAGGWTPVPGHRHDRLRRVPLVAGTLAALAGAVALLLWRRRRRTTW
ncbi:DUF4397 domain-containing protein [Micromonospora sp. M12]